MYTEKYNIDTNDKIIHQGRNLFRIISTGKIPYYPAGRKGGYIEGRHNLSDDGISWIHNNAKVYGQAYVGEDAQVFGHAEVYDDANVTGNATVNDRAKVFGNAVVTQYGLVRDNARVFGCARVTGCARVQENGTIKHNGFITDRCIVYGSATVTENGYLAGIVQVCGCAVIEGSVRIEGRISISGSTQMSGRWSLMGECDIRKGNWTEPPIIMQGSRGFVYETKPGIIRFGNEIGTITQWSGFMNEWLGCFDLQEHERLTYRNMIELMIKMIRRRNKRINVEPVRKERVATLEHTLDPELQRHYTTVINESRVVDAGVTARNLVDRIPVIDENEYYTDVNYGDSAEMREARELVRTMQRYYSHLSVPSEGQSYSAWRREVDAPIPSAIDEVLFNEWQHALDMVG